MRSRWSTIRGPTFDCDAQSRPSSHSHGTSRGTSLILADVALGRGCRLGLLVACGRLDVSCIYLGNVLQYCNW